MLPLLLLCCLLLGCRAQSLPSLSVTDLLAGNTGQAAAHLATTGIAVTGLPAEYGAAVARVRAAAPGDLARLDVAERSLPDGSTRQTVGQETGESWAELGLAAALAADCRTVSRYFDLVDGLVSALIAATESPAAVQWQSEGGLAGNLTSAQYKEHLHVYRGQGGGPGWAAPLHTDNGLLLLVTPSGGQQPLTVADPRDGSLLSTQSLSDTAVIVLVGSGLSDWLLGPASQFQPSLHGVPAAATTAPRTVLARMKVAPDSALPPAGTTQFGEFFQGGGHFCRPDPAWDSLQEGQCTEGTAYCWMGCLPLVPDCEESLQYCVNMDGAACCTQSITEDCISMDGSCQWQC